MESGAPGTGEEEVEAEEDEGNEEADKLVAAIEAMKKRQGAAR